MLFLMLNRFPVSEAVVFPVLVTVNWIPGDQIEGGFQDVGQIWTGCGIEAEGQKGVAVAVVSQLQA